MGFGRWKVGRDQTCPDFSWWDPTRVPKRQTTSETTSTGGRSSWVGNPPTKTCLRWRQKCHLHIEILVPTQDFSSGTHTSRQVYNSSNLLVIWPVKHPFTEDVFFPQLPCLITPRVVRGKKEECSPWIWGKTANLRRTHIRWSHTFKHIPTISIFIPGYLHEITIILDIQIPHVETTRKQNGPHWRPQLSPKDGTHGPCDRATFLRGGSMAMPSKDEGYRFSGKDGPKSMWIWFSLSSGIW